MQMVMAECIGITADFSVYKKNRELLSNALKNMGFEFSDPDGAFYLFLKAPDLDSKSFCENAMKYNILLVPGTEFGIESHARISYCVSQECIERSLNAFYNLAKEYNLV